MVERQPIELSEDETALYDRQIRLWGYEAQWKLKNGRMLIVGIDGLGAEIVKNIVLSGVRSVVMWDDKVVGEKEFENQFLISRDSLNQNRAEASKDRAQALNPLVEIECDSQPFSEKLPGFFEDFSLVISCNQDPAMNLSLDDQCSKAGTKFISTGVYGTFGYAFYNLNKHNFSKETVVSTWTGDVKKVSMNTINYPTLKEVLDWDLKTDDMSKFLRKVPASIFIYKALVEFEEKNGRRPTEKDVPALLEIRESLLGGTSIPSESFPEIIPKCLVSGMPSPVCAIVGAAVSQESVVIVTQKGEPQRNFFFFNPIKLIGHVQYIGPEL